MEHQKGVNILYLVVTVVFGIAAVVDIAEGHLTNALSSAALALAFLCLFLNGRHPHTVLRKMAYVFIFASVVLLFYRLYLAY